MASILSTPPFPLRGPTGDFIEPGTLKKVLDWDPMFDAALPAWLTVATPASSSIVTATAGVPGVRLAIPSTGPTSQTLGLTSGISTTPTGKTLAAVMFEVRGLKTVDDCQGNQIVLAVSDSTNVVGVRTNHPLNGNAASSTVTTCDQITLCSTGAVTDTTYRAATYWGGSTVNGAAVSPNRQINGVNLGLLVNFVTEQTYLFEGDECVAAVNGSGALGRGSAGSTATIIPRLQLYGTNSRNILVSGVRLTVWYN